MNLSELTRLKRSFYKRDVLTVAQELLGKILVKSDHKFLLAAKIVEVEAYDGSVDQAAHTYIGKTKRNEIMFGEGGYLYVYFTYGAHYCCNVVTGQAGQGTAILIRALEPLAGIEQMYINRYGKFLSDQKSKYNLTSGPGKVCKALEITRVNYGEDLVSGQIYLLHQRKLPDDRIIRTKRIGIRKSTELEWRFYIKDNPFVSKR